MYYRLFGTVFNTTRKVSKYIEILLCNETHYKAGTKIAITKWKFVLISSHAHAI